MTFVQEFVSSRDKCGSVETSTTGESVIGEGVGVDGPFEGRRNQSRFSMEEILQQDPRRSVRVARLEGVIG